ncbi:unnamed protein product, partial [Iphiclides podalirius]
MSRIVLNCGVASATRVRSYAQKHRLRQTSGVILLTNGLALRGHTDAWSQTLQKALPMRLARIYSVTRLPNPDFLRDKVLMDHFLRIRDDGSKAGSTAEASRRSAPRDSYQEAQSMHTNREGTQGPRVLRPKRVKPDSVSACVSPKQGASDVMLPGGRCVPKQLIVRPP